MSTRSGPLWFVAITFIVGIGGGVASAQLLGPLEVPPGGVTVEADGADDLIGFTGGLTLQFTDLDPTAYSTLYWGPLPDNVKLATAGDEGGDPTDPFEGLEILVFDLAGSNLGAGVAEWHGETDEKWSNGSSWVVSLLYTDFTLSTTTLAGAPIALIDATSVELSDGAVLPVGDDFKANLFMELAYLGPAIEFFNSDTTDPDDPLYNTIYTWFEGGFWYTGEANLTVTKEIDTVIAGVGSTVVYTITASNAGPQSATALEIYEPLHAGLTYVSDDGGGDYDSGTGVWSIDKIASGSQTVLNITAAVNPGTIGTTITNTAELTLAQQTDPNSTPGNGDPSEDDQDSASVDIYNMVDATASKDDGQPTAIPGEEITYIVQIRNDSGPDPIVGATVTDTFPAEITGADWTCLAVGSATCTLIGSGDINDTVNLPVGGVVTYTIDATVSHLATGTLVNTASVSVPAWHQDTVPANNTATDTDTLLELDYGDAPDSPPWVYPTVYWDGGARHVIVAGLSLGSLVDGETDGQPNGTATGDDDDGSDDEDGVVFDTPVLIPGTTADVTVTSSTAGYLNAWVDFNGNGSWADAGEKVFSDEPLSGGPTPLQFAVPAGPALDFHYARFRFTSYNTNGQLGAYGLADDGEVEDYKVPFEYIFADDFESGDTSTWSATTG